MLMYSILIPDKNDIIANLNLIQTNGYINCVLPIFEEGTINVGITKRVRSRTNGTNEISLWSEEDYE